VRAFLVVTLTPALSRRTGRGSRGLTGKREKGEILKI
jgi:hypothetical protein